MEVLAEQLGTKYPFSMFSPDAYDKMLLPFPIGYYSRGLIVADLAEFPHLFVAAETSFGKSNLLHVILNSVLLYRPEAWTIVIDPKETEFSYTETYSMILSEPANIVIVLRELNAFMDHRKKKLKAAKAVNIQKYLDQGKEMALILVIIDELAELQ